MVPKLNNPYITKGAVGGLINAGSPGGMEQVVEQPDYTPTANQTPFKVSESDRGMSPTQVTAGGQHEVSGRPNPNSAMETYSRNSGPFSGLSGPSAMPTNGGMNPFITSTGESALGANIQAQLRGRDQKAAYEAAQLRARPFAPISTVLQDPSVTGLLQSIYESSAHKIATGAHTFGDAPGYFDTQNPDAVNQLKRTDYLRNSDMNAYGKSFV